jgi:hypothetical protein
VWNLVFDAEGRTGGRGEYDGRSLCNAEHHNLHSSPKIVTEVQTKDDDEMMDGHTERVSDHKRTLNIRSKA